VAASRASPGDEGAAFATEAGLVQGRACIHRVLHRLA